MRREQIAPIIGRPDRLVPSVEFGAALRPFNGERILAHLGESLRGVLVPRGDPCVAQMGSDDRRDVLVEYREPAFIPLEHKTNMRIRRRRSLLFRRGGPKAFRDAIERGPILPEASL